MRLTLATETGMSYRNVFQSVSDDSTTEEEITAEAYAAIQTQGTNLPTLEGYVWQHAYGKFVYDTTSGDLEDGCYSKTSDAYLAKVVGFPPTQVELGDVDADGNLSDSALAMIQSQQL